MSISRLLRNSLYSNGVYFIPIIANSARWIVLLVAANYFIPSFGIGGLAIAYVASSVSVVLIMFVFFVNDNDNRLLS